MKEPIVYAIVARAIERLLKNGSQAASYYNIFISESERESILQDVRNVFERWKLGLADRDGMVDVVKSGLINSAAGFTERLRVDSLEPWKCASPSISGNVDLALFLWATEHARFVRVVDKFGFSNVFSAVALEYQDETALQSLVRIGDLLVGELIRDHWALMWTHGQELPLAEKGKKMLAALEEGRKVSAAKRSERRAERDRQIRQMGADVWQRKPAAKVEDVAKYICTLVKKIKQSTVEKKLKGVKTATLKAMGTNVPRQ